MVLLKGKLLKCKNYVENDSFNIIFHSNWDRRLYFCPWAMVKSMKAFTFKNSLRYTDLLPCNYTIQGKARGHGRLHQCRQTYITSVVHLVNSIFPPEVFPGIDPDGRHKRPLMGGEGQRLWDHRLIWHSNKVGYILVMDSS